jgi:Carboxypeptidase regulatory-like domain/TonB dependent receptor-like, beta-barrel
MQRLNRVLAASVIVTGVGTMGSFSASTALAQSAQYQSVRTARGSITGIVSDDRGGPIGGAMVSALGTAMMAKATTDASGFFAIDALPIGEYTVQAHRSGFAGSARAVVRVSGYAPSSQRLQLRRLEGPVATSGTAPVEARPIMAAGIGLPGGTLADQPDGEKPADSVDKDDHSHSETAWRLRHIKRSVLKDASPIVTVVERDDDIPSGITSGSLLGRAMVSAASMATTFFNDLPFSGEVNLLTTSAFGPGGLFSGDLLPRGVAYLAIGAPTGAGTWSVRAAMSQGDLSSWNVAGGFQSKGTGSPHLYKFGLSYSAQDYVGGNPAALAAATDGSRNVGEMYAFDRWALTSRVAVEYGGRYGRFDYLESRGLFSPRVGITIEPIDKTRISAYVAQRMVAPGAEEFVASEAPGPWLPPERTFAPLGGLGRANTFSTERARYLDLMVEHEFDAPYVIGVRRFYQNVDDQLVTLFGLNVPGGPQSVGHYYVANAGSLGADGWAVRLSTAPGKRITGSIDYSVTRARWLTRGDMGDIAAWAPAAVRPETEDLHDVTTSLATEIPETATRVYVFYKINTGYTRSDQLLTRPGLDARFDLQVNQALPFDLAGTRWEVLVGLRNLFRDPNDPASVYDELLVVKPPKRVVGGFLVRF